MIISIRWLCFWGVCSSACLYLWLLQKQCVDLHELFHVGEAKITLWERSGPYSGYKKKTNKKQSVPVNGLCASWLCVISFRVQVNSNSNFNWTFTAFNFPYSKGTLKHNNTNLSIQGQKKAKHHRKTRWVRLRWICLGVQVGFELHFWKRLGRGTHESHQEEHSKEWGIKSRKLLDIFMDRVKVKKNRLKVAKTNLTLKGESKVKPTRLGAHDFLEVVFSPKTSKTNNKADTGHWQYQ